MKTAIDRNESEFDKLKREALEWIENPKSRLVPSFIKIAVETAQQAQPDKGDKPTGQFEEDYPVYDEKYLNECIKKAKPNLSKIKDVDKTLDEIRGNGTDKEIMTKQEIIKLYLGDLKNIVKESPARNNRIAILESELSAIDKQVKEAENTLVEVIKDLPSNERRIAILFCAEMLYRKANPNSKMDVPSIVYEHTEQLYDDWIKSQSNQKGGE